MDSVDVDLDAVRSRVQRRCPWTVAGQSRIFLDHCRGFFQALTVSRSSPSSIRQPDVVQLCIQFDGLVDSACLL